MTANDYYAINEARARRDGVRRGAALAALPCVMLGVAIMLAVHLSITWAVGRQHDETVRLLTVERDRLRGDVARYAEIAELEKAYAERRSE